MQSDPPSAPWDDDQESDDPLVMSKIAVGSRLGRKPLESEDGILVVNQYTSRGLLGLGMTNKDGG